MTENLGSYDDWIRALREARIFDHINDTSKLDPEKIKPVTLSVPAWAAATMDHKCPDCGWPVYVVDIGSTRYPHCINPECYHSTTFRSITDNLQHSDRMRWEREERTRVKEAKRESERRGRDEEEQRLERATENRVRRILLSYGVKIRGKAET
ncbi:MAG: hypothetical protein NTV61_06165 [Candidatus Bathyarchaeota archaeon]|nr:hypothetical protein [Candidatus Bathyarchaeota archaeon]